MPISNDAQVFNRVTVDHLTLGGTRVEWSLDRNFILRDPHEFQLQVSDSALPGGDWIDVGLPVSDAYFAVDDDQRNFGLVQSTHYRVQLTTTDGVFHSPAAPTFGLLRRYDWNKARAIIRRERLRHEHFASPSGYLLRRKWGGESPAEELFEVDPLTGEPTRSKGSTTHGTAFVGGYYAATAFHVDLSPAGADLTQGQLGTGKPEPVAGRAVPFPQINSRDLWVHASSDIRYEVLTVKHLAEIRGVPIVVQLALAPLPRTDQAYSVPLPA